MTSRLAVTGLRHRYPGGAGVIDVSMAIAPGERVALLGPNGAGKTTLLLNLAGLLPPHAGTICLDGRAMRVPHDIEAWRAAVGVLFQDSDHQLFGPSVIADVAIGPRNRGLSLEDARAHAWSVLRRLGIESLGGELVHALSGGQRRAVALAGVLAQSPGVLLLDEPTLGLDATAEDQLLLTLEQVRREGAGILLATHDVDLACRWADTVIIMQGGRVIARGQACDVLTDEHIAVARLRRPWILDAARELRRVGLLPSHEPLPRSGSDLLAVLRRAAADCRSQMSVA